MVWFVSSKSSAAVFLKKFLDLDLQQYPLPGVAAGHRSVSFFSAHAFHTGFYYDLVCAGKKDGIDMNSYVLTVLISFVIFDSLRMWSSESNAPKP